MNKKPSLDMQQNTQQDTKCMLDDIKSIQNSIKSMKDDITKEINAVERGLKTSIAAR